MIRQVEILGLRAIRHARVALGGFQVLVGPNASGKSTFFDAIHLVSDILIDGIENAVFGNPRLGIVQRAASSADLTWLREGGEVEIVLLVDLPEEIQQAHKQKYPLARYELSIDTEPELRIGKETLFLCQEDRKLTRLVRQRTLFPAPKPAQQRIVLPPGRRTPPGWRKVINKVGESGNDYFRSETSGWNNQFRLGPNKSALANLPEDVEKFPAATWVKRFLMEHTDRLVLNAEAMRLPSPAGSTREFRPDGSNLPWVVHELEQRHPSRLNAWIEHVQTALDDVEAIRTVERPEDRSRYIELRYRNGLKAPSWLLSDGTLRMLALTLLAYIPAGPGLVLIEEPENGIHPQAVESVMQSISSTPGSQIFCATHSALVLSFVDSRQLLCFAKNARGEVDIIRGDQHPRLKEWKSSLHLGDLFAAGVLG